MIVYITIKIQLIHLAHESKAYKNVEHLENYSTLVERSSMFYQPFLHSTGGLEMENITKKYLRNYKQAKLHVYKNCKNTLHVMILD